MHTYVYRQIAIRTSQEQHQAVVRITFFIHLVFNNFYLYHLRTPTVYSAPHAQLRAQPVQQAGRSPNQQCLERRWGISRILYRYFSNRTAKKPRRDANAMRTREKQKNAVPEFLKADYRALDDKPAQGRGPAVTNIRMRQPPGTQCTPPAPLLIVCGDMTALCNA